jgi:NAD(P)-dependent dehydrogenase (short-subunit alcohol dehydrogenase family)
VAAADPLTLDGARVLVTHVRGFVGLPAAKACAARGAQVLCHDPSFACAEESATFGRANPELTPVEAGEPDALAHALQPLDAVILNDDHPAVRAPLGPAAVDELRAALDALCVVPFARAAHFADAMRRRGGGKLIFVTSAAPLRGIANYAPYVTARGAQNAMVKTLALELGGANIKVIGFAPNFVASSTYFPEALLNDPAKRAKIEANIPLGRLASPEEAGATLAFLVSPTADFLTGAVVPFAGGWA